MLNALVRWTLIGLGPGLGDQLDVQDFHSFTTVRRALGRLAISASADAAALVFAAVCLVLLATCFCGSLADDVAREAASDISRAASALPRSAAGARRCSCSTSRSRRTESGIERRSSTGPRNGNNPSNALWPVSPILPAMISTFCRAR